MSAASAHPYELLATALSHPGPDLFAVAGSLPAALEERCPEASEHAAPFGAYIGSTDLGTLEEHYTGTFDVLAPCCLEVGWQIFGETYKRGAFLVRMRRAVRAHGLEERGELSDHLATVLRHVLVAPVPYLWRRPQLVLWYRNRRTLRMRKGAR